MSAPAAAPLTTPAPLRRSWLARAVVVSVWAGAAAGALLGAVSLVTDDSPSRPGASASASKAKALGLSDRVATSFGSMSVDYAVRLSGGERPMGVQAGRGEIPIQVGVTVTNLQRRPLAITPEMFTLPGASRGHIAAGALDGGKVKALSAHRILLRYAVPDAATLPRVRFRDPDGRPAIAVALGRRDELGQLNATTHEFNRGTTP